MNEVQFEAHGYLKRWSAYTLNYIIINIRIMNILQWSKIFTHISALIEKINHYYVYTQSFSSISYSKRQGYSIKQSSHCFS